MARKPPVPEVPPADLFERRAQRRERLRHVDWQTELHTGQVPIARDRHRFRTVCNGRRWGKSYLASREAVERANAAQALVMLCAPTYKTAKNGVWSHLLNNLQPKYRKVNAGDMTVELTGGGRVMVGSLDQADNLRGAGTGLAGIIVDEAAFVPDYAVESVLRPMLMDCNGWLLAISTPKGRVGWFYRYWMRGQSGDPKDKDYKSWSAPTWTNPTLPNLDAEIDDLRNSMPSNVFNQEIAAEFVDDAGAVFRNVQLCELATPPTKAGLPPITPGADYYAGVDFARTGRDFSVVFVVEKDPATGELRQVYMDRWGRLGDKEQVNRLGGTLRHFNPRRSLCEENSFGGVYVSWMQDLFGIRVERFTTSGSSKDPLIQQAAAAFEFEHIEIWPESHPLGRVLVNELLSYQRIISKADHAQYSAPEGFNDDTVMSCALAIRAADGDPELPAEGGHFEPGGAAAHSVPGGSGMAAISAEELRRFMNV